MSRKTRVYFGFRGKARARAVQESPSISPHLLAASNGRLRPASVTDASTLSRSETSSGTSSQPNESASSLDDSDSKSDKTDHSSSSEESEKDCPIPRRSKGPPRKRIKSLKDVQEFTTENVMEHSKRMKYTTERITKDPSKY